MLGLYDLIDYVDITNYYPTENDFSNFNVIRTGR